MFDPLPGWSWDLRDTGVILTSELGRIRYRERIQPHRTARDAIPPLAGFTPSGEPRIERLLTHEHEYAALITIDGAPARRTLGVVWLDDWYALIDGIASTLAHADALTDTVRTLTLADTHMRGERRRRFLFTPPPGWSGVLVPPYHAYWLAPDFPRGGTYLAVFPAQPRAAMHQDPRAFVGAAAALGAGHQEHARQTSPASNRHGLSGVQIEAEVTGLARATTRTFVLLEDRRYMYPLMLEAPVERVPALASTLQTVIDSIEPLPAPAAAHMPALWPE